MDPRHIELLRRLILTHKPHRAVEIGSYKGESTQAFLDAMQELPDLTLDVVDPKIRQELVDRVKLAGLEDRVNFVLDPVFDVPVLGGDPDLVFIDGDHRWPALGDMSWALASGASVVAMHATQSHVHNIPNTLGAYRAANILRNAYGRVWNEDAEIREKEWTHRGFGWSVTCDKDTPIQHER